MAEDDKIVDLYIERSTSAISCTAEKYGSKLRSISQRITGDYQTSEECENDTYLEAWNSIPPNEPRTYFFAFLIRICRHLSINCCRNRDRLKRKAFITEISEEMEQCISSPSDVEGQMDEKLLGEAISRFLRDVNEEKRNIFLRRYWYLDSIAAIAKRFSITESKVKVILFRIRNELKEYLLKEGYEL